MPEELPPDQQSPQPDGHPPDDRIRDDGRSWFGDDFPSDDRLPPDEEDLPTRGLATWSLRPGHLVVIAVLLLVAVGGVGVMVLRDRPVRESVSTRPVATATPVVAITAPGATTTGSSPTPPSMLVHVAGKVRKPGVIRLPPGSRVIDAVSASGGALNGVDLAALNLARPLTDGEQVLVGVTAPPGMPGQLSPAGSAGASSTGLPATPVNLNTATPEELETLPGVGPVLAQRIVEFRLSQGNFTSIEELRNVTGIGEQKYADLRDRVTV